MALGLHFKKCIRKRQSLKLIPIKSSSVAKLTLVSLLLPLFQVLGASSSPQVINNPQLSPQPQQPQSSQSQQGSDRSGSAGAAQAMQAMGAAMAGMSCIMLLKQAQEAPPDQKAMLQSMAMQQCAQAAQNAASAAQNGDQKKKLDETAPTNQAQPFQAPEMKQPDDSSPAVDLTKNSADPTSSDSNKDTTPKPTPLEIPPQAGANKTDIASNKPAPEAPLVPGKSTPQLMDKDTITAKKDAKEDSSSSGDEASKQFGSAVAGKGSADDLLKKALAENGPVLPPGPMIRPEGGGKRENGAEGEGSGSGGGSSNGETKGADPFDSLLAQMMGGQGAGTSLDMGVGGGTQILSLPKDKNGQPKLNIFQFATSVYSDLAHSRNRITMRPNKMAANSQRNLSSVTNSVVKASIR
jgi:hypothetical protein